MAQPIDMPTPSSKEQKRVKDRGHMFIVDVPTFAKVCSLKDADVAAAYLILAAGTGADNRTSTWSSEAINRRTALNWRKAKVAMSKLEEAGLLQWLSGKGTRKPRIDLPPIETRNPMRANVAALFKKIEKGHQPQSAKEKGAATMGERDGWLVRDEGGVFSTVPNRPLVKAFMPMELVGDAFGSSAKGMSTVVDRVRMSRDPMALQLLVDLYALQDLAEHGGVDRQHFYLKCERERAGSTGNLQLWKFARGGSWVSWKGALDHHWREPTAQEKKAGKNAGADFFSRAEILADAGALEWVYYLAEDETDTSPLIYPVAVERHGKMVWTELESIIGGYAIRAACALSGIASERLEHAKQWEATAPWEFILPADRIARQAALIGIPRLRHRARTLNASRWMKELIDGATGIVDTFRGIIAENAPELLAEADRRLADFNGGSTLASTVLQRDINDSSQSPTHEFRSLRERCENEFSPNDSVNDQEGLIETGIGNPLRVPGTGRG